MSMGVKELKIEIYANKCHKPGIVKKEKKWKKLARALEEQSQPNEYTVLFNR